MCVGSTMRMTRAARFSASTRWTTRRCTGRSSTGLRCARRFAVDTHWLEKGKLALDGRGTNSPELAALVALHKTMGELGAHKAITFHHRVVAAGAFAALCNAVPAAHAGNIVPAFHVNGKMK